MKKLIVLSLLMVPVLMSCSSKEEDGSQDKAEQKKELTPKERADRLYSTIKEKASSYKEGEKVDMKKINTEMMHMKMDVVKLNPEHPKADELVYESAGHAQALGQYRKAVSLLDQLTEKYRKSKFIPLAMYMKANILDLDMADKDAAADVYQEFIDRYKDDEKYQVYVEEARERLKNIDLSPEEIIARAKGEQV